MISVIACRPIKTMRLEPPAPQSVALRGWPKSFKVVDVFGQESWVIAYNLAQARYWAAFNHVVRRWLEDMGFNRLLG